MNDIMTEELIDMIDYDYAQRTISEELYKQFVESLKLVNLN